MSDSPMPFLVAILCLCCLLVGRSCGRKHEAQLWKQEMVERGHATWKVNPDGTTEFIWK